MDHDLPQQMSLFKVCSDCGEAKAPEDFVPDKTKPSGRRNRCKVCQQIINRQRDRQRQRPNNAERQRTWHAKNPDKRRVYRLRWEARNPEKAKEHQRESNRKQRERKKATKAAGEQQS